MTHAEPFQPGVLTHRIAGVFPERLGEQNLDPTMGAERPAELFLIARRVGEKVDRLVSLEVFGKAANAQRCVR